MKKRLLNIIFSFCICTSIFLTGCENLPKTIENTKNPVSDNISKEEITDETEVITEKINTKDQVEEKSKTKLNQQKPIITVSTPKEIIEAIRPNVVIYLEPGYYNLSEFIEKTWMECDESWNNEHPYARIRTCYDGVELLIQNADNLTIIGNKSNIAETEIVVEPRYAGVLNFLNCKNLDISYLTAGHTETGACVGNVLNFYGCDDVNINHNDLYGCGVYGISAYNATKDLKVYNTIIRDCSSGPLALVDCRGKVEFKECSFTGSINGGYYNDNGVSELAFYNCTFGPKETYTWTLYDVIKENCLWADLEEYSKYSYWENNYTEIDVPELNVDNLSIIPFDNEVLAGTFWNGHSTVNPENGETVYLPVKNEYTEYFDTVSIELYDDNTGIFEYFGEYFDIKWECDDKYSAYIELDENRKLYLTLYTDKNANENNIWMMLHSYEENIWLY